MRNIKQRITVGIASFAIAASTLGALPVAAFAEEGTTGETATSETTAGKTETSETTAGEAAEDGAIADVWERIWGQGAYDTMLEVVKAGVEDGKFTKGGTVIVAQGDGYWDALAASSLAGQYNSPVVLTNTKQVYKQTTEALELLEPKTILVMGGPVAVEPSVFQELKKYASDTAQRIYGEAAPDTALEIMNAGTYEGDTFIVATADGYWDALSIAPYANAKNVPILLTKSDADPKARVLPENVAGVVEQAGFKKAIIVGGKLAVSEDIEDQLKKLGVEPTRIYGEDAIETSAEIAAWEIKKQGMTPEYLSVATTEGYHDALTGASLVGRQNSALVLAHPKGGLKAVRALYSDSDIKDYVMYGQVFGGHLAISDENLKFINILDKMDKEFPVNWAGETDKGYKVLLEEKEQYGGANPLSGTLTLYQQGKEKDAKIFEGDIVIAEDGKSFSITDANNGKVTVTYGALTEESKLPVVITSEDTDFGECELDAPDAEEFKELMEEFQKVNKE